MLQVDQNLQWLTTKYGIPQGSLIGQLLFTINIEDKLSSTDLHKDLSADDSTGYIYSSFTKIGFKNQSNQT